MGALAGGARMTLPPDIVADLGREVTVGLRPEHGVESLRCQRIGDAVIKWSRGMDSKELAEKGLKFRKEMFGGEVVEP